MASEKVSLSNLAAGAAVERFDDELNRVLENIMDPNTGEAAREITLKVKITPNEKRDFCKVLIECSSKTAAAKKQETHMYIGWDKTDGTVKATEYNPQQVNMNFQPSAAGNVMPMKGAAAK